MLATRGEKVRVVAHEQTRPFAPALRALRVTLPLQMRPHESVEMKRVRIVMIEGLVDAVLEPATAALHGLELVQMRLDHRAIGATRIAVLPEELENVNGHE